MFRISYKVAQPVLPDSWALQLGRSVEDAIVQNKGPELRTSDVLSYYAARIRLQIYDNVSSSGQVIYSLVISWLVNHHLQ